MEFVAVTPDGTLKVQLEATGGVFGGKIMVQIPGAEVDRPSLAAQVNESVGPVNPDGAW